MSTRAFSKFTVGRDPNPFRCKMCNRMKNARLRTHKIIFGRRHFYDICQKCTPHNIQWTAPPRKEPKQVIKA